MPSLVGEVYARSPLPLGNGTFAPDGRLVVSHHPLYETAERVSVFTGPKTLAPFPNAIWNTPRGDSEDWLDAVLGLHTDARGCIWLLDMGTRSHVTPKFVIWDCRSDTLSRVIRLPPSVLTPHSEPNDFAIDEQRGAVYIADEGAGNGGDGSMAALIVLDTETGRARRRLEGRPGIRAEDRPLIIDGHEVMRTGKDGRRMRMRVGVDGIALDGHNEWLYYGPMTGDAIWRVRTDDLLNESLDDDALQRRLERYAARPNAGGMCMDAAGTLYLTEVEGRSIGCIDAAERRYWRVLTRDDLFWPDDVVSGPDGAIYVVVSQLPHAPPFNGGENRAQPPFVVVRFLPE